MAKTAVLKLLANGATMSITLSVFIHTVSNRLKERQGSRDRERSNYI